MGNYIQIEFQNILTAEAEMLMAELSLLGFEGFEEEENLLKAFIPEADFDDLALKEIIDRRKILFKQSTIPQTNWNAVWESNFQPVIVDDFVGIRASFHTPIENVKHEIVITPKMSFGTGHHATTHMMIQHMREIDFTGKSVFDFGTGTGILAILAEKLGAAKIHAIDNDEWSITNAQENIKSNNAETIIIENEATVPVTYKYDIILANINKNVIIENLKSLAVNLNPGGILLLSGLLIEDESGILTETCKTGLSLKAKKVEKNWISLRFSC